MLAITPLITHPKVDSDAVGPYRLTDSNAFHGLGFLSCFSGMQILCYRPPAADGWWEIQPYFFFSHAMF